MVPPQPRLTSPPLGVVGGRGAPEALPSLLPPPPPTPGRAATICGYSFTRQKKKVCRMSHTEKKKKIRNRAKKTCEWAWRMGLLKLRRSRGSPSHSASLRERSRARPARPPAPWTSEQVGARRPRPRPPPPPGSRQIRFPSFPQGVSSRGQAGEPGAAPACGARAGAGGHGPGALERGRAGTRHSWSPLGGARRWPERGGQPGRPADLGGGHLEPGETGSRDPGGPSPAPKSGERVRGGSGSAGGDGARGEGGGRERKRAGGRGLGGARGRAGGRRGEADTSGRAALPPRPAGRGGREGGRARGGRRAEPRRAGPGRAAGVAASSLRAARPEPTMLPVAGEPAAGRGRAAAASPPGRPAVAWE